MSERVTDLINQSIHQSINLSISQQLSKITTLHHNIISNDGSLLEEKEAVSDQEQEKHQHQHQLYTRSVMTDRPLFEKKK